MDKKQMRALALARRDGLAKEQRRVGSDRIVAQLTELSCYLEADTLLTYVSFRSEVDTIPLIRRALTEGKAVFTPRVSGRDMEFFRMVSLGDLKEGYRGILEPQGTDSYTDHISQNTLICLPGAAFDRNHHRIGYGGGFYDRYLWKLQERQEGKISTAALAFACQIFEEIPWEAHDICPACIITEKEIIEQKGIG